MVSCPMHDWLDGRTTRSSEPQGSSSDLLVPTDTSLHRFRSNLLQSGPNFLHLRRTLRNSGGPREEIKIVEGSADHQNFRDIRQLIRCNGGAKNLGTCIAVSNRIEARRGANMQTISCRHAPQCHITERKGPPLFCGSFTKLNQIHYRNLFAGHPDGVISEGELEENGGAFNVPTTPLPQADAASSLGPLKRTSQATNTSPSWSSTFTTSLLTTMM
jgi:hypothetical protein